MKFMLMMGMKQDPESQSKGIATWSQAEIQAYQFMMGLNRTQAGSRRRRRHSGHRRGVRGIEGVPDRLLDHRGRNRGSSLCGSGDGVGGTGARRPSPEHAD